MRALSRLADRTAQALALVGSLGVILMMLHVGADILARSLFGRPIPATVEIVSRYYMVLIAFLPLAWVERRRGMVAVEVTDWLLSPTARRVTDVAVALFACLIYAVIAWTTWGQAMSSWRSGSFVIALNMRVPVWPTYFLPPLGFALAAAVTLVRVSEIVTGTEPDEREPAP
jgi:TRAP-type C4-dicarboxylate transport system permease small subunit